VMVARVDYWIDQCLMDLVHCGDNATSKSRLGNFFLKLVTMTEFLKELVPAVHEFLTKYIHSWNGLEHQEQIFKLLTFLRPGTFDQIYTGFLEPLNKLFVVSTASWKAKLIHCYTDLLKYWILLHVTRQNDMEKQNLNGNISPINTVTIHNFIDYINENAQNALEIENDHIEIQHAVLSFVETITFLQIKHEWDKIFIPSSSIVYRSFFSSSGMALSRICGIILKLKEGFDRCAGVRQNTQDHINYFNSYVMDICNCLWRNRPFNKTDKNAKGFQFDDDVIDQMQKMCGEDYSNFFSLTHLPSLAMMSKNCIQALEDSTPYVLKRLSKPVTHASLRQGRSAGGIDISYNNFRVHFLDELLGRGYIGLYTFLCQSITQLKDRSSFGRDNVLRSSVS
ncbi:10282_t:CDS:10, partial [Acaulospora morrowiae]